MLENRGKEQENELENGRKRAPARNAHLVLVASSSVYAATCRHSDLQPNPREGFYLHLPVASHLIWGGGTIRTGTCTFDTPR